MWVALATTPAAPAVAARERPSSTSRTACSQAPSSTQANRPVRCKVCASAWSSAASRMIVAASIARSRTAALRSPRRTLIATAASSALARNGVRCGAAARVASSQRLPSAKCPRASQKRHRLTASCSATAGSSARPLDSAARRLSCSTSRAWGVSLMTPTARSGSCAAAKAT